MIEAGTENFMSLPKDFKFNVVESFIFSQSSVRIFSNLTSGHIKKVIRTTVAFCKYSIINGTKNKKLSLLLVLPCHKMWELK